MGKYRLDHEMANVRRGRAGRKLGVRKCFFMPCSRTFQPKDVAEIYCSQNCIDQANRVLLGRDGRRGRPRKEPLSLPPQPLLTHPLPGPGVEREAAQAAQERIPPVDVCPDGPIRPILPHYGSAVCPCGRRIYWPNRFCGRCGND